MINRLTKEFCKVFKERYLKSYSEKVSVPTILINYESRINYIFDIFIKSIRELINLDNDNSDLFIVKESYEFTISKIIREFSDAVSYVNHLVTCCVLDDKQLNARQGYVHNQYLYTTLYPESYNGIITNMTINLAEALNDPASKEYMKSRNASTYRLYDKFIKLYKSMSYKHIFYVERGRKFVNIRYNKSKIFDSCDKDQDMVMAIPTDAYYTFNRAQESFSNKINTMASYIRIYSAIDREEDKEYFKSIHSNVFNATKSCLVEFDRICSMYMNSDLRSRYEMRPYDFTLLTTRDYNEFIELVRAKLNEASNIISDPKNNKIPIIIEARNMLTLFNACFYNYMNMLTLIL